jgi:hypothetical protein
MESLFLHWDEPPSHFAVKLTGALMRVATFERIGFGQWFRYLTGSNISSAQIPMSV